MGTLRRFCVVASSRAFLHLRKPEYTNFESLRPLQRLLNSCHFATTTNPLSSVAQGSTALGQLPKLKKSLSYTCNKCNTRNHRIISKQAYEKGIVIVRCDGCENLHLIADNLDWFQNPNGKNIEDILAAKGEKVITDGDMIEIELKVEGNQSKNGE